MIKVRRMGWGDMPVPPHFLRDLKVIEPKFHVIWIPKAQKYAIVTQQPPNVFRDGYFVEYLVEKDRKFAPLDNRVLRAIRMLLYEKNRMRRLDDYLKQIDEEEEMEVQRAIKEQGEMETDFMKKVHKFQTEKTFT